MLADATRSVAEMAVTRFGLDRARVQQACQAVLEAQAQGKSLDLVDLLLDHRLLTREQAQEVRFSLDKTQVDLASAKNKAVNGHAGDGLTGNGLTGNGQTGNGQTGNGATTNGAGAVAGTQELRTLGEYRILRRLGEGGMGAVFLAYQQSEDRQVAIKVLPDHLAGNQVALDRFYREARSGKLLNHPNIVRNIAEGQDRQTGRHYLVLEYVDGVSAQALLDRFGNLKVSDAVHIILDIARALEHAHSRNVVHRDIKPGNILITNTGVAKLSDLGLAKRTDETSHLTHARQGFGTPYYMPYEQAMNARSANGRSDIFALGATLYHLVTGEVPFAGANHVEIVEKKNLGFYELASVRNPAVPAVLDQILEKMLAREPRDRYQTASELIVDLERSGLAPVVPSFVDADKALQDPVVQQRLTIAAQATCPDLSMPQDSANSANDKPAEPPAYWYVRFRDRHGQMCKGKATTPQIVKRLDEGRLSPHAELARQPSGNYVALHRLPEFKQAAARALATWPAESNGRAASHGAWFWLAMSLGIGLIAAGAWLLLQVYFSAG